MMAVLKRALDARPHRFSFWALLFIFLSVLAVYGQSPERLNYQGRLLDGAGLVDGSLPMVFRLYTNETGGVATYAETQTVQVVDGLYAVTIGASNPAPGSLSAALAAQPCYLEIEVNGTTLSPREMISSVAYAMQANEGDPVWLAEKASYATGTPLYAYTETDPVWSSEKSGYATGTPLYAYTETDPVWAAEKSAYATGTPLYVDDDSAYATGTPLYVFTESDPVWGSEKSGYATGTPVYVEADPNAVLASGARPMTGHLDMGKNGITNVGAEIEFSLANGWNASLSMVSNDLVRLEGAVLADHVSKNQTNTFLFVTNAGSGNNPYPYYVGKRNSPSLEDRESLWVNGCLVLEDGGAWGLVPRPLNAAANNAVLLYTVDVGFGAHLYVRDENGNVSVLGYNAVPFIPTSVPKTSDPVDWYHYSEKHSVSPPRALGVDMIRALRLLERTTGEKLVNVKALEGPTVPDPESLSAYRAQGGAVLSETVDKLLARVKVLEDEVARLGAENDELRSMLEKGH